MTSIRSNLSALKALQALKTTQTSFRKAQEQISTGLRVKEAADNASYWSIGVKMRSDLGALGAVKDSIRQSVAMLDTFTSALDKALACLNKIKQGLVSAFQPGADVAAIQNEINAHIKGLKGIAGSATINGQNWLSGPGGTANLVVSYDGAAHKVNTLAFDTSHTLLFADTSTGIGGILGDVAAIDIASETPRLRLKSLNPVGSTINRGSDAPPVVLIGTRGADTLVGGIGNDTLIGGLGADRLWGGAGADVFMYTSVGDSRIGGRDVIRDWEAIDRLDLSAIDANSIESGHQVMVFAGYSAALDHAVGAGRVKYFHDNGNTYVVGDVSGDGLADFKIDIIGTHTLTLESATEFYSDALRKIDTAIERVTQGSAWIGATKAVLEANEEFLGVLTDALNKGVGAYIDTDMMESSTRWQALQAQQQLGIQALAITNVNSQMLLKLLQ